MLCFPFTQMQESDMSLLKGKAVIISGATSGIGMASAKLFAKEQARLVLTGRNREVLKIFSKELAQSGTDVCWLAGDIQDEHFHQQLVELALTKFGCLDVAFNNAATLGTAGPATEMTLDDWQQVIQTNLTSAFLAARVQIPELLKTQGSLIFTSSFVGHLTGFPGMAAYAASKAGVVGLVRALAAEYSGQGMRVNALLPGGTDTPMGRAYADTPEAQAFIASLHCLKRLAQPEEIARSALYLASELSSFTTGSALLADGGVSMCKT
jgi:NAD(P)-dependent dehydrogenase (short-subunit alcohol dehydrogenase family)